MLGSVPPPVIHEPPPEWGLVRILAEAGSLPEAAQGLLELIARHFGWQVGDLWLVEDSGLTLHCVGSWSDADPTLAEFRRLSDQLTFPPGVGLPGVVWASGRPEWIADLTTREQFPRAATARAAGLHGAVGLPVTSPAGVIGVMEFLARDVREFDARQLELLETLGRQVGQYVARVQAEERLAYSEESSASIVSAALDCIFTMDHQGHVLDLNPAAEATFGYPRAAVVGQLLGDLIVPPAHREAHYAGLARYLATGEPRILDERLELTGMRADGSTLPVELTVTRLGTRNPPVFAGFLRDITRRRSSEREVARLLELERDARVRAELAERSARSVADVLQRSLLPPHLPTVPGFELGAAYRAGAEGTMVGGDFYDVFELGDGRWGVAIGDVRGKGAHAASVTALMRYTIRTAAVREPTPSEVLQLLNRALLSDDPASGDFCTAIYGVLDVSIPDEPALCLAVGGHPLPLRRSGGDGTVGPVGEPGTLLGAVDDPQITDTHVTLSPGDVLLLFTDGVIESRTPDGFFGTERLSDLLAECDGLDADAIAGRVEAAVVRSSGSRSADDVAVLALRACP
jgi:sigma-B regulation protein RsbU (phosphoserine phosphatase)